MVPSRGLAALPSVGLTVALAAAVPAQDGNLLIGSDFSSLAAWQENETLRAQGRVTPLPDEKGVLIENPDLARDGTLSQTVPTGGHRWFSASCRIKHGANTGAALALVALDADGRELRTFVPFRIGHWESTRWDSYRRTISVPGGTQAIRLELVVLNGRCAFADLALRKAEQPEAQGPRIELLEGHGFSVRRRETKRPLWEIFVDDLDADGAPEVVACDVDGVVTVRTQDDRLLLRHEPGALVYQFASADLDDDGRKEVLLTTVSPRTPLRAVNLEGEVVRTFPDVMGHQRLAVADMNGDGKVEVAAGVSGGVGLFAADGTKLWDTEYRYCEFHFADVHRDPGLELLIGYGGPRTRFPIYDRAGQQLGSYEFEDARRIFTKCFAIADIDTDGAQETVVLRDDLSLLCLRGDEEVWRNALPGGLLGDFGLLRVGDLAPALSGLESALVGTHYLFVFDAEGNIVYRSSEEARWQMGYFNHWLPDRIRPLGAALWCGDQTRLYLSSSGYRDPGFYELTFGEGDELRDYRLPDREEHLDTIYRALKARAPLPPTGEGKFKIVYVRNWGSRSEEELRALRSVLDGLEAPAVEFTLMYDPSDLKGHPRGAKMTTDQIVERARLFERLRLPFGYFAAHGCQVWISDEAIRRTIEAAPTMFRYLYVAEDFEAFYRPEYRPFLEWCDRMLGLCAQHDLKMLFKEKHDVWGLLPADPEIAGVVFRPEYRNVIVPIYSTNQVYQPEIQWGGMIGLKAAGWCDEFGMSTQWWNWTEWKIRDLSAAYVCPSDITLRLELLGAALGATWFHIEGGQPYLDNDPTKGFAPLVTRHRDLVYELMRNSILTPQAPPANVNSNALIRSLHPEFEKAKAEQRQIVYPYFQRNVEPLRQGFIPATHMFEPYPEDSFPRLAYGSAWNGITCFPTTPLGWVAIVAPAAEIPDGLQTLETDGERVRAGDTWVASETAADSVARRLAEGAEGFELEAPGTCVVVQRPDQSDARRLRVFLIDPGYLAPQGVKTTLTLRGAGHVQVTDLVSGEPLPARGNECPLVIEPGAFRALDVTMAP